MPKGKMRSKEEILGNISSESDYIDIVEALLDIRDILDERMSGIEISGIVEEKSSEVTMLGRPVVNVRTRKRVKEEDLEGKVWYIDLKSMKKRR